MFVVRLFCSLLALIALIALTALIVLTALIALLACLLFSSVGSLADFLFQLIAPSTFASASSLQCCIVRPSPNLSVAVLRAGDDGGGGDDEDDDGNSDNDKDDSDHGGDDDVLTPTSIHPHGHADPLPLALFSRPVVVAVVVVVLLLLLLLMMMIMVMVVVFVVVMLYRATTDSKRTPGAAALCCTPCSPPACPSIETSLGAPGTLHAERSSSTAYYEIVSLSYNTGKTFKLLVVPVRLHAPSRCSCFLFYDCATIDRAMYC